MTSPLELSPRPGVADVSKPSVVSHHPQATRRVYATSMGNAKSGALSKEILDDLKTSTKYSEDELSNWYKGFLKQCPDGKITRTDFEKIYANFFPNSDPKTYARHVFRSFDTNDDGTLDFREYIIALHLTSSGKTSLKLEWAFSLFDVDRNGEISKVEVLEIITVSRILCLTSDSITQLVI